jgi:hypothetical protein
MHADCEERFPCRTRCIKDLVEGRLRPFFALSSGSGSVSFASAFPLVFDSDSDFDHDFNTDLGEKGRENGHDTVPARHILGSRRA